MARKDLSRTVIEGGRYYRNSYDRRASHGIARTRTRAWLDQLALDDDDDTAPVPLPYVYKSFRDKLGPVKRWLRAQVGLPWSRVFSDLCARFDTRTVAGRHVVHDHLLPWVQRNNDLTWRRHQDFFVDAHGILREARSWRRLSRAATELAAGRRAALTFFGWLWFHLEPAGTRCLDLQTCRQRHYSFAGCFYHRTRYVVAGRVMPGELRRLARLPPELRAQIEIDASAVVADPAIRPR